MSEPTEKQTPRTDEFSEGYQSFSDWKAFARQLETELAAAEALAIQMTAEREHNAMEALAMRAERDSALALVERLTAVIYDGHAVYSALSEPASRRTSAENVSDTLDALARIVAPKSLSPTTTEKPNQQ